MAYSKLFSSIVHSSIWTETDSTRLLFITLLAIADRSGEVYGSKNGIGRIANIEPDDIEEGFRRLMSPDPDSGDLTRAPENEGRRIEAIPGGFRLLNYEYYRGLRNDDDRREQNRAAQKRHKEKQSAKVSQDNPDSSPLSHGNPISEAESEADTDALAPGESGGSPLQGATALPTREIRAAFREMPKPPRGARKTEELRKAAKAKLEAASKERSESHGIGEQGNPDREPRA